MFLFNEQNKNMKGFNLIADRGRFSSQPVGMQKSNYFTLAKSQFRTRQMYQIDNNILTKNIRSYRKKAIKLDNLLIPAKQHQKQAKRNQTSLTLQQKSNRYTELFGYSPQQTTGLKLYHPSIYHFPQTRKKYFCHVVDSYFSKSTLPIQNSQGRYQNNKINNMTFFNRNINNRVLTQPYRPINTDRKRKLNSKAISKNYGISVINEHERYNGNINQPQESQVNLFKSPLKKLKTKYKLASATTTTYDNNFGLSQRSKGSRKLIKSHFNTTSSISHDNVSNQDQSKQKQTFSQSVESLPKSQAPSRHDSSKQMQNSLLVKLKQHITKIPQSLFEQIKQRLSQIKIIIHQQPAHSRIISEQKMYRMLIIGINQHLTYRKFSQNKILIKQFKQDQKSKRMSNINIKIKQLNVTNLWNQLPKIAKARLNDNQLFYSPCCKTLREQFFRFRVNEKIDNGGLSYTIHPTSKYFKIFDNNCQYFRDIIVSLAEDLLKMRGKLINNNICLDNVYRLQEKCIKIGDWGHSAMYKRLMVVGEQVILKDEPILTIRETPTNQEQPSKNIKWLISPQNLPPQIIKCLIDNKFELIWEKEDCPEVWSLGIMIFELLTAVPVWMPCPTGIGHKVPRVGYFYDPLKRLSCIHQLQTKMPNIVNRWFRDEKNQFSSNRTHPQILNLMKQMLHVNAKLRPKPEEIIWKLKNI